MSNKNKKNPGLSSFDIYAITHELQNLINSYIDGIYQIENDTIILRIKKRDTGSKETLFIRNAELICRTNHQFIAPKKPSVFTMILRKYLLNGTIKSIEQYDFDRIILIKITKREGVYTLVLELFKNGNIILVDSNNIILQSLLTQRWAHRLIKTHEPYKPPGITQVNPLTITSDEFKDIIKRSNKDLVRTLAIDLNMSGLYAEELCYRAELDKNLKAKNMNDRIINKLYTELQGLVTPFKKHEFKPVIIKKDDETINILPVTLKSYQEYEQIMVESFSLALQDYIKRKTEKQNELIRYDEQLDKLQRKLEQQKQSLNDFVKLKDEKQHEAELLYKYADKIQNLLDDIQLVLKQKDKTDNIQRIRNNKIVKEFEPNNGQITLQLKDDEDREHSITIDFRRTVMENASFLYDESKKYKEKIKGAEEAIKETIDEINKIKEHRKVIEDTNEEPIEKKEKTFWFERYRWSISTNGNLIIGGRDAKTNEQIVKKHLKPNDRYIHADIHGAPSCIVKSEDIQGRHLPIDDKTLEEASVFAACYSKAWKQYGDVNVYWVYPEQVSKTPPTGEYLPKGSFMIRGERHYYRCKLEIAIGEVTIQGVKKIMIGSIDTLSKHSKRYAVITPGATKISSIAKILSKTFNTTPDTIIKALPPGDINIVRTIGFNLPSEMMNK
ncbi:MAG: ribosome rescue protein RqcH [Candidatus Thermoplasmatota archaeon]